MDFAFAKIKGTAGWYYNKWPDFLTVDAYRIVEAFSTQHLRTQELKGNERQRIEEPEEDDNIVQFQCTEQGSEDTAPIR